MLWWWLHVIITTQWNRAKKNHFLFFSTLVFLSSSLKLKSTQIVLCGQIYVWNAQLGKHLSGSKNRYIECMRARKCEWKCESLLAATAPLVSDRLPHAKMLHCILFARFSNKDAASRINKKNGSIQECDKKTGMVQKEWRCDGFCCADRNAAFSQQENFIMYTHTNNSSIYR